MKIKKIIIVLNFFLLLSCGFEPIYLKKENIVGQNFTINNIGFSGDNNINQNLKNSLKNYINVKGKQKEYDLIIDSSSKKIITSKNEKGNPEIYYTEVIVKIDVLINDKIKSNKTFIEGFEYKNKSRKHELKKYERTIIKNLTSKISQEIIKFLYSL